MPAGPLPKAPGQRRRRNLGQSQWRTFAAEPRRGEVPPLPTRKPSWSSSTRAFWRRVWRAPMAAAYLDADLGALHRLAELHERHVRGDLDGAGHTAMMQLEDRFGLSPRARQMLQWQVLAAGEAPSEATLATTSSATPGSANVRRLRAVDPKAADG